MIVPTLRARVKQSFGLICVGINSRNMIIFMVVAALAAQRQIAQFG
jgi:hypothetical protein